jgi:hypothetical protein
MGKEGWDIDTVTVNGILQSVGTHAGGEDGSGGLAGMLTSFNGHIEAAGTAAASNPIGTALVEFVTHYSDDLSGMVTKTGSAIKGCVDACGFYLDGDYTMAADAQSEAGTLENLDL